MHVIFTQYISKLEIHVVGIGQIFLGRLYSVICILSHGLHAVLFLTHVLQSKGYIGCKLPIIGRFDIPKKVFLR